MALTRRERLTASPVLCSSLLPRWRSYRCVPGNSQLRYLEPSLNGTAYYAYIDPVIQAYATANVTLILSFTAPVAPWMVVNACPPPTTKCDTVNIMPPALPPEIPASLAPTDPSASLGSGEWSTLSSNIGQSIGRYIDHLWNHTTIPHAWLQTKFYIEPYNEFDAMPSFMDSRLLAPPPGVRPSCTRSYGGRIIRRRAATYQVTMPSIGGANAGLLYPGLTSPTAMGHWIQDYYAQANVWGAPNVHIAYGPFATTAVSLVAQVRAHLAALVPYIPQAQQGHLMLTEAGAAAQSSQCADGMAPNYRANLYSKLAQDAGVGSSPQVLNLTMWRLQDLSSPQTGCEASYGIVNSDGSWKSEGINLIAFLKSP